MPDDEETGLYTINKLFSYLWPLLSCKQFGPKSGQTEHWAWFGSKLSHLWFSWKIIFKKANSKKFNWQKKIWTIQFWACKFSTQVSQKHNLLPKHNMYHHAASAWLFYINWRLRADNYTWLVSVLLTNRVRYLQQHLVIQPNGKIRLVM